MSRLNMGKFGIVVVFMMISLFCIQGCDIFDPDSDDTDDDQPPVVTNTPVPTRTPMPTATPFLPRPGTWSGSVVTSSFESAETGAIQLILIPDHLTGTADIWVWDTYTADGGGPFRLRVHFDGTSDGMMVSAYGTSPVYDPYWDFYLEGFFVDAENAQGLWRCIGGSPTDAIWDDHGTWTAVHLHE